MLNKKTKVIFVTGGVYSGLGKGISSSVIGAILKYYNYQVTMLKYDPYLNIDAGTMSPEQHGEVFVTADGAETDLDVGNYERFLNINLTKSANVTAGRIYRDILKKERKGHFLGSTIQVVPHITNLINQKILDLGQQTDADFIIVEIGGTIGDIETLPFLEALRQFQVDFYKQTLIVHLIPLIISFKQTLKTKPLQHSIKNLISCGIFPQLLFVRSKTKLSKILKEKITATTGVNIASIFSFPNEKHIYLLTKRLQKQGLDQAIFTHFNLTKKHYTIDHKWDDFISLVKKPKKNKTKIAIIGKYSKNSDAYLSLISALEICSFYANTLLFLNYVDAAFLTQDNINILSKNDAVIVPGGFGKRDVWGKILAIEYCRINKKPFLGLCLGLQLLCVEFAINVIGLKEANSVEFNPYAKDPVIILSKKQFENTKLGGTLRLGSYPCSVKLNTQAYAAYQKAIIFERHRHRYEFNWKYKPLFEQHGLVFSGINETEKMVEIVELGQHPFFLATQFHPEFNNTTLKPHPLFMYFLQKIII